MPALKTVVPSILEQDAPQALKRLQDLPAGCTLVEIRGDLLSAEDLAAVVDRSAHDVIVTIRRESEGGSFRGPESERLVLFKAALQAGAAYVDLEIDSGSGADDVVPRERRVLSWHDDGRQGNLLQAILARMQSRGAASYKLVPRAERLGDLAAIRDFLQAVPEDGPAVTCFGSGRHGPLSRILALSWGSRWVFAYPGGGRETAAGQFPVRELTELYEVGSIGASTRMFGLIGTDLADSPSPAMHNSALRDLGLDARYLPMEIDRFEDLAALADPAGPVGAAGFGVTMPFKEDAAAFADELDRDGAASGAVNTLVPTPAGWIGFNTDASAIRQLAGPALGRPGTRALVHGAGGTARTAAVVLRDAGAQVTLVGRNRARIRQVARELRVGCASTWNEAGSAHILVNATPEGRTGEPWPGHRKLPSRLVLDAPYCRGETDLVRKGRECGLAVVSGRDMMLEQALEQFRLLTGGRPRREVMAEALAQWFRGIPLD